MGFDIYGLQPLVNTAKPTILDKDWLELTEKERHLFAGNIFNAIKAPEACFEKYGLPKTTVNTIRFSLNCAYGFKLPYREDTHYAIEYESKNFQILVERKIYE